MFGDGVVLPHRFTAPILTELSSSRQQADSCPRPDTRCQDPGDHFYEPECHLRSPNRSLTSRSCGLTDSRIWLSILRVEMAGKLPAQRSCDQSKERVTDSHEMLGDPADIRAELMPVHLWVQSCNRCNPC